MDEQLEFARQLSEDPGYRAGMPILLDNRQRGEPSTPDLVAEMSRRSQQTPLLTSESRCAVVVASNVEFGMARMFATLTGDARMKTRVFRDLAEAERWLLATAAT